MKPSNSRYPLFEHLKDEHGITLLDSEIDEIIRIVEGVQQRKEQDPKDTRMFKRIPITDDLDTSAGRLIEFPNYKKDGNVKIVHTSLHVGSHLSTGFWYKEIVLPTNGEINQEAYEWAVDYKPFADDLLANDYAEYGYQNGAKSLIENLKKQ